MADKQTTSSGGVGIGGALFLVFLVLKLTGYINWSWWWVTAPLWGTAGLVIFFLLLIAFSALVVTWLKK